MESSVQMGGLVLYEIYQPLCMSRIFQDISGHSRAPTWVQSYWDLELHWVQWKPMLFISYPGLLSLIFLNIRRWAWIFLLLPLTRLSPHFVNEFCWGLFSPFPLPPSPPFSFLSCLFLSVLSRILWTSLGQLSSLAANPCNLDLAVFYISSLPTNW